MDKLIFLTIIAMFTTIAIWFGMFMPQEHISKKEVLFAVERGEGSRDIAMRLQEGGLIPSSSLFRLFVLVLGISGKLQAGTYLFSPSMSPIEISRKLAAGDVVKEEITVIEGWNLRDIGLLLENKGMFRAEELWELAGFPAVDYRNAPNLPFPKDFLDDFPFLKDKPSFVGLEGYLFPDTYRVRAGESAKESVKRMLSNFQDKIADFENEIARQKRTLFEVLTLASLLEKEVPSQKDRALVAGVLQNRLSLGMPLQVDATISYLTGKKTVQITKDDTEIDSPFNTYKYPDFPLGPIANPGLQSIEAALFPKENPYLYYLSTLNGETIFSKTLEEHNAAKVRFLR
ncbi:MAG: hypothetical protein A3I39_01375 [Candidatus Yanofskybacteria bacterium RIFCSPLOWO2_02_FULL_47_9b]|uniref:Endolytic murein transglycosylase n=1 Tax=Candidatus Yanofskybacteria bacterium RIFCSPLOWO2_02_FULL_47_9b TaxID=1802708 RepID=A0A1F8HAD0_9BACT|nr:MAG: hypothetical protein A3I39_01375 [Candidatus Yanofskybacteria bacterium RIFCSPLOWO2_02_FULL_47_9b]